VDVLYVQDEHMVWKDKIKSKHMVTISCVFNGNTWYR